jgi:hypothetical protein
MKQTMAFEETTLSETPSAEDLRTLAEAQGPCITAVIRIPEPGQLRIRITNALRHMEPELKNAGMEDPKITGLLQPIREMAAAMERDGEWSVALAVFRSLDLFRYFFLRELTSEFITVDQHFQIRPLLTLISRDQLFYILALSQKHVRLYRCTYQSEQEVQLRRLAPENLHVWMNNRIPDHVLDNRSAAGPSLGSMKGVLFGTNTDRERMEEYLWHFFKEVDKGIHHVLIHDTAPLLLAGVETEVALYRKLNTYPHVMEAALQGSPEKMTPSELYDRALPVVRENLSGPLRKVLSEFKRYRDANRVLVKVDEILPRVFEGRVSDLLLREDAVYMGVCYEAGVPAAREQARQEDLLNLAALQAILHGGQAFSLKEYQMPEPVDAAALLRF